MHNFYTELPKSAVVIKMASKISLIEKSEIQQFIYNIIHENCWILLKLYKMKGFCSLFNTENANCYRKSNNGGS